MSESAPSELAFRIVIAADIQRVWRELTKTGEAQGAVFNAWLHTLGSIVPGAAMQMRTGSGKHTLVVGEVLECQPPHRFARGRHRNPELRGQPAQGQRLTGRQFAMHHLLAQGPIEPVMRRKARVDRAWKIWGKGHGTSVTTGAPVGQPSSSGAAKT